MTPNGAPGGPERRRGEGRTPGRRAGLSWRRRVTNWVMLGGTAVATALRMQSPYMNRLRYFR